MKKFISLIVLGVLTSVTAYAYTKPERVDTKFASQQMIEKRSIDNAVVADPNRVLSAQATSASVITTVTSFLAQPDVCRAVSVTPGGTTADVPAGDIVVSGTNVFGQSITETLTLTANQATIENGLSAFCTLTSVVFPIQDGAGATYDVGVIDVLGLHRCMSADNVVFATFDGAYEATRATAVYDVDEVEKNTVDLNGTLDGAKDAVVYFIQNFQCLP